MCWPKPDLFVLTFSLKPGSMNASQLSEKNAQVHDQLYRDGDVVVNKFNLRDYGNVLSFGRGQKITCLGSLFGRATTARKICAGYLPSSKTRPLPF